jgi:hypothetical protein
MPKIWLQSQPVSSKMRIMKKYLVGFFLLLSACAPVLQQQSQDYLNIGDKLEVFGVTRDGREFKKSFIIAKKEPIEAELGGGWKYGSTESSLLYAAFFLEYRNLSVNGFSDSALGWFDACDAEPKNFKWTTLSGRLTSIHPSTEKENVSFGLEHPTTCVMTRQPRLP